MFTLLILFVIGYGIYKCVTPDKKSKKRQKEDAERLAQLPDISFFAKQMSALQKTLNLWPSDKDILQVFRYTSANQSIYLKMKDGRFINCPLDLLEVSFEKTNGLYRIVAKNNSMKFSFYGFDYVYTSKEWSIIYSVLTLAGKTHNVEIMGSTYKNIAKANTILKVIKAMS